MSAAPALPPLVDAATLAAALASERPPIVLDASASLSVPDGGGTYAAHTGYPDYLDAHLPGALFADVIDELADPDAPFLFTLPSPERLAAAFGALGIGADDHVVVYDTSMHAWATRVWWLLRVAGHDAVSVLDGGLRAWVADGRPVEQGDAAERAVVARHFAATYRPHLVAETAEIADGLGQPDRAVVNALDGATFRGDGPTTAYARRGRIPGSRNLPFVELLEPATGRFRPVDELADALRSVGLLGTPRAITYCGGGVAATVPAFVAHLVDGTEIAVYDGSLSEWTADPTLPLELG